MSSGSSAPSHRGTSRSSDGTVGDALRLEASEQTLLSTSVMKPRLERLPDEAFRNLLVVSTGLHPTAVQREVERRGLDPRSVGVVPITSTYLDYDGPLWVTERVAPSDLTGISVALARGFRYVEPGAGWLAFDSISTLLMYSEETRLFRLVDWLIANGRRNDVRGVYALMRSTVEETTYRRFSGLCDTIVDET